MARSDADRFGAVEFLGDEEPGGGEDGTRVTPTAVGAVAFLARWR